MFKQTYWKLLHRFSLFVLSILPAPYYKLNFDNKADARASISNKQLVTPWPKTRKFFLKHIERYENRLEKLLNESWARAMLRAKFDKDFILDFPFNLPECNKILDRWNVLAGTNVTADYGSWKTLPNNLTLTMGELEDFMKAIEQSNSENVELVKKLKKAHSKMKKFNGHSVYNRVNGNVEKVW